MRQVWVGHGESGTLGGAPQESWGYQVLMQSNEAGTDGERGVIINTASVAGLEGQTGQVAYSGPVVFLPEERILLAIEDVTDRKRVEPAVAHRSDNR